MTVDRLRGWRLWRALPPILCGVAALLCGCHGSDIVLPGTPVLTIGGQTSTPDPDFASYVVDIDSITLTHNDGTVVEPLSSVEVVDLTKLTTMAELVEAPAVPEGTYLSATMTIDYSAASIALYYQGGTVIAEPLDTTGAVMTSATITITFDPNHPLVINAGQSNRLNIDFDLAAFNTINSYGTSSTDATIPVQPFVVMTPAAVDQTIMRVRGELVVVQSPGQLHHQCAAVLRFVFRTRRHPVNVSPQTYYNINGTSYTGTAGLTALSDTQLVNTSAAAYGTLDDLSGITPTFNATQVYAGTSLESPLAEYISGTVTERSGYVLGMRSVTYLDPEGDTLIYPSAQVQLDGNTILNKDGVGATLARLDLGRLTDHRGRASRHRG